MTLRRALLCLGLLTVACASPAKAGKKAGVAAGFTLQPGTTKIVLMPLAVQVGSQAANGKREPDQTWTSQAVVNMNMALRDVQGRLGSDVTVFENGLSSADAATTDQYAKLFHAVADSAIRHQLTSKERLPTKKRAKTFEWEVGPDLMKVPALRNADYALFMGTRDDFGSAGRKVVQVVGLIAGFGVTSGDHFGYAGLIDIKTGKLVWLATDSAMGGDVRTVDGATKRVQQLLDGFPGKSAKLATVAAK